MAKQALAVAGTRRSGGVSVWWDLETGEYLALHRRGLIALALHQRVDAWMLRAYVGEWDSSVKFHDIYEALLAHSDGELRGAA